MKEKLIEIKERLKQITWLRKIVRAIKAVLNQIYICIHRVFTFYYLKKNNKKVEGKIRIGFILQVTMVWDKLKPVYDLIKDNPNFEVFTFAIPQDDFRTYEIKPNYENNYFCKEYPDHIKLLDENGKCLDLKDYDLDYLFYQKPFDYRLPKKIGARRMVRYTRCCYIPYAYKASDLFNFNNVTNDFFDNTYFLFLDSPYMKRLFEKKYPLENKLGLKKMEYLGYPALEKYIICGQNEKSEGYITWTPRWSFEDSSGNSNFLKYKDNYLEFIKKHKAKHIFRPHPLMEEEIVFRGIMSKEEWDNYLKELAENGVIYDIKSPIDDVLRKTEILITDYSTIIGNFTYLNRPIVYCDTGVVFNEPYQKISELMYYANDWDEVERDIKNLHNGIDVKKAQREEYIKEESKVILGSSQRIVDEIIKDARK